MIQPELTLVSHKLCAYVQRAAIVLLEKNVRFERIDIDLSAKPDWFLAMSPTGKVPMLQVKWDGRAPVSLFESVPICEYLDETLGRPRTLPRREFEERASYSVTSAPIFDLKRSREWSIGGIEGKSYPDIAQCRHCKR